MSFPTVTPGTGTNGTAATTTPAVNLPTAGFYPGDFFFGILRVAVAGTITGPAGWTIQTNESADAADDQQALFFKRIQGNEGSSASFGSGNGKFAAIVWAITLGRDPQAYIRGFDASQLSTVATGTSAAQPNATAVTPTIPSGADDFLFGCVYGMEGEQTGITSYPASYTLGQTFANSGTGGAVTTNVTVGGAWRQLNAASDDPGAWTVAGTLDDWTCYAIAIYPSAGYVKLNNYLFADVPSASGVSVTDRIR